MTIFESLFLLATLNIVYQVGFFAVSCWLGVAREHYFLGYGKALFTFRVSGVKFSIGWYIPIFLLARIYTVNAEGQKGAMVYPWELADRPLWRRWLATWSGVTALIVCAWVAYVVHTVSETDTVLTREDLNQYGIDPTDAAEAAGFRAGDKIVRLNGKEYDAFEDLIKPSASTYTVLRGDSVFDITLSLDDMLNLITASDGHFLLPRVPFRVESVRPGSPAEAAGIAPGDRITTLDGAPVMSLRDLQNLLQQDTGSHTVLEIERYENNQKIRVEKHVAWPDVRTEQEPGKRTLGISSEQLIPYTHRSRTWLQAARMGTRFVSSYFTTSVRGIFAVIAPRSRSKLSGPISMSAVNPAFERRLATGALTVWILNILPMPFAVFWETIALLYEGVTRKKYPEAAFRWSWIAGLTVFVGYVLFTFIRDLTHLF
ncbi:PDZ domain-containing protein [Dawidia soli]|uniref:PDZ domain-containing protein n=1 Tax=Dawidia soli TaxID=2782352 RepID=A0AAP2DAU0_9BACT|nr:PDZ domain-containing protein [Dawidia soli]MBT1687210.1 PDZ domain-containing protein [Dawidia soli]